MGQSPGRRLAVTDLVLMKRLRLDELQRRRESSLFQAVGARWAERQFGACAV